MNNTLSIFLRFLKIKKSLFATCVILILIVTSFNLVIPIFFKIIIDYIILNKITNLLNTFFIVLLIIFILQVVIRFLQDFAYMIFRQKLEQEMLINYIDEIFRLKVDVLLNTDKGDLINRAVNYINTFQISFVTIVYYFLYAIFISIIISIFMFFLNPYIFLCMVIFLGLHIVNFWVFSKKIGTVSSQYFKTKSGVSSLLLTYFDGYIQIATSWLKKIFIKKYNQIISDQYRLSFINSIFTNLQQVVQNILIAVNQVVIFYIGGKFVIQGDITVGTLMLFLLLMNFLYAPIYRLSEVNRRINDAKVQLNRLYDIIDNKEKENNERISHSFEKEKIKSIVLRNITFDYNKNNVIFNKLNFQFEPGTIYLFVGQSGAGKTTLFNLLSKLYEPSEGKILINNYNISQLPIEILRNRIGVLTQNHHAFTGTIAENITFFDEGYNKHEVVTAAENSTAAFFINKLPHSYNSSVMDGGRNISGGEKQRLNIARFLYENKDILLLDEPTANIDEVNEKIFMQNLNKLKENKIIIIISHNQKIKKYCDVIIKLTNKKIVIL